ncbi:Ataxin-3 [Vanrija pseudolonga]|uniref:ubiquitinyl hydrolase 1 n=1 Tax=Vanrija pseudolonga TaxID=143232 RepID=A0AAF1BRJ6_9TREE|nr:Ataxin-3 [Vanrija pseudolonga]
MDLVPYIFHELQEPGSLLCAQHCLNNLLQQPVYTEIDLADLARRLDEAESAATYRAPGAKSYNYDDTGFFSISVLEKAMQVWDLTLVRWRGEAMRPFQEHPEVQAAFILNLESHWFALRRFGDSTRWYNLNSFLPAPEWISPTYLQMVLKQAEEEGYSVFAVRRSGEGAGEEPTDVGEAAGWEDGGIGILPESGADIMAIELGPVHGRGGSVAPPSFSVATGVAGPSQPRSAPAVPADEETPAAGSGRYRRRQADPESIDVDEEDEAPQASRRARSSRGGRGSWARDAHEQLLEELNAQAAEDDEELDIDEDELEQQQQQPHAASVFAQQFYAGPTDFAYHSRSYDDEDEALQAALKASMADLPPDFVLPELKPKEPLPRPAGSVSPPTLPAQAPEPVPDDEEYATAEEEEEELEEDDDDAPAQELSPDEIRRARLARFQ